MIHPTEIHRGVKIVNGNNSGMIIEVHRCDISPPGDPVLENINYYTELTGLNTTHYHSIRSCDKSWVGGTIENVLRLVNKQKHPPECELIIFPSYCRCGVSSK